METGEINRHKATPGEIGRLLKMADESLNLAELHTPNTDWKFKIAYSAIINLADAGLRALGFRARSVSSHYYTLESLSNTINPDEDTMRMIDSFRELRHQVTYMEHGLISDTYSDEIIQIACEIQDKMITWLKEKHPNLMQE